MKKYIFVLYFFMHIGFILAFQFTGNPQSWRQIDLIGFDKIGDATKLGDIASVYFRQETDDSFLRITFDDLVVRKNLKFSKDNYKDENIELIIKIGERNFRLKLNQLSLEKNKYDFLCTPQNNLLELKIPNFVAQNKQMSIKTVLIGKLQLTFSEAISTETGEDDANYQLQGLSGSYTVEEAVLTHNHRVVLTAHIDFTADGLDEVVLQNITDLNYELVTNDLQPQNIPQAAKITAVYPNPFTPTSTKKRYIEIKFKLKSSQQIQLSAYNIKGQLVKKWAAGKFGTGEHKINWNMQQQELATRIYFTRLQATANSDVRRMLYLI